MLSSPITHSLHVYDIVCGVSNRDFVFKPLHTAMTFGGGGHPDPDDQGATVAAAGTAAGGGGGGAEAALATAARGALAVRMEWMWQDAGFGSALAKKNPLRWSGGTAVEVAASLRAHGVGKKAQKPVLLRIEAGGGSGGSGGEGRSSTGAGARASLNLNRSALLREVRKRLLLRCHFDTKTNFFYQDRLGTTQERLKKRAAFLK
jgi:hypothetical protein|eukprot:COSAG06_NODE_1491_length_9280_cov_2.615075_6_plen_204_part_00